MTADNFKINLNQNIWGLILSLMALGTAEYYELCTLYWFGLVLSGLTSLSFVVTLFAYTVNYCKKKL
jgi:hypothetical protein